MIQFTQSFEIHIILKEEAMQANRLYPCFSEEEFSRRNQAVRRIMRELDLAAIIFSGTSSAYNEVLYLSNFLVTREAMLIFPFQGDTTLFVQMYNHVPNARRVSIINDVRWGGPDTAVTTAHHLLERGFGNSKIGIAGAMSFKHYETLKQAMPEATLVDVTRQMMQLRLIKSEEELAFLRKGAELSDRAIQALEREARPGLTEHDLTAIIEGAYLNLGGKTHIHYLASTPMQHPNVCVPAQIPSSRVIEQGDVLITEISAHFHGYPGQILRPFAIGTPPTPAYQRMYDVAAEAFSRIANVIHDGAIIEAVLDAAEYIHTSGFTICDDLLHGFGGGYLPPILRTRLTSASEPAPFTFRENMTIVIQPNVITEDERMGVQVGELMRVTRTGIESLHSYPMRFIQCG
jgi:Xaa-Pro dipeptidase